MVPCSLLIAFETPETCIYGPIYDIVHYSSTLELLDLLQLSHRNVPRSREHRQGACRDPMQLPTLLCFVAVARGVSPAPQAACRHRSNAAPRQESSKHPEAEHVFLLHFKKHTVECTMYEMMNNTNVIYTQYSINMYYI